MRLSPPLLLPGVRPQS